MATQDGQPRRKGTRLELVTALGLLLASAVVLGQRIGLVPQPEWWTARWAGPGATRVGAVPPVIRLSPGILVSLEGATLKGESKAAVGMLIFEEYECPWCQRLEATTLPAVVKAYVDNGRVLLGLRHFPLQNLHRHALKASEATECAGRQGRFWEMRESLFRAPGDLAEPSLIARAVGLGLSRETFVSCLGGAATGEVLDDHARGTSLGVTGTPTLFFGRMTSKDTVTLTRRLNGARSVQEIRAVLDELLGEADVGTRSGEVGR